MLAVVTVLSVSSCGADTHTSAPKHASRETGPGHQKPSVVFASVSWPFANSGRPRLQFEGDSITFRSAAKIRAHYRGRYDVAIHGTVGVDTYEEVANVSKQAALRPRVEVINLGTNDAHQNGQVVSRTVSGQRIVIEPAQTLEQVLARFDAMTAQFSPATCVVLVTVNTHNPSWGPANARAINDHIRALAQAEDAVVVADWNRGWHPSYFDSANNPHPNTRGQSVLLTIEDRAIARCNRH
jgi:hypothetical protein